MLASCQLVFVLFIVIVPDIIYISLYLAPWMNPIEDLMVQAVEATISKHQREEAGRLAT